MDTRGRISSSSSSIFHEDRQVKSSEDTSTPFPISDWYDIQFVNYCLACGIDLNKSHNHHLAYFTKIYQLESKRIVTPGTQQGPPKQV